MEIALTSAGKKSSKKVSLSDVVFGCDFNEPLVHQAVTIHLARGRAGTKAQKNRSAVSGGGSKPWRQKGTGRARAGTIRSPIWRTGGVTFAATPKDYSKIRFPKKMYRAAMRSILSELLRREVMIVVDNLEMKAPKTKDFVAEMKQLEVTNALFITTELDENLYFASRNVPNVTVIDTIGIDPVVLLKHERVVITEAALKQLEERLQ